MRKALVVGIDHYRHVAPLTGCVSDAKRVAAILATNGDDTKNFGCRTLIAPDPATAISRQQLKEQVRDLFATKAEIVLFYFAGHGHVDSTGGHLYGSDSKTGDDGLSLNDVVALANQSPADNKIIVLDSCHSGIAGNLPANLDMTSIVEGVIVLTASTAHQYAEESGGHGLFTSLLVDALAGGAANLTGDVTPGSVYTYVDQSLGEWQQRPVFKANVRAFVSLRKVPAPIALNDLRKIVDLFATPDARFRLDPSFEPEVAGRSPDMPPPVEAHTRVFEVLQRYNRLGLLVPHDAKHMWAAAMRSKSCRLTPLGEHYWRLARDGLI
jgi:uncharacterized caspase-like protein